VQTHTRPEQGRWYYDVERDRRLLVTWVDEEETLIEARFEDGHREHFPQAAWRDLRLKAEHREDAGDPSNWGMRPDRDEGC
jgi:hypothetical protein